jgi:hypothetical protein
MNNKLLAALVVAALLAACGGGEPVATQAIKTAVAPSANWSVAASAPAAVAPSAYWSGVARVLPVTPHGNRVAVSCHNCYGDTLADNTASVALAKARNMDLIELDVMRQADGTVYVQHEAKKPSHTTLADTLAITDLKASDRMLFLEVKERYTDADTSDSLMRSILRQVRDGGYSAAGRPAFIRAIYDGRQQHLQRAKKMLADSEFADIRDHVRLHTLHMWDKDMSAKDIRDIRRHIRTTKSEGFHGVELQYQMPDLYGALMQAKLLGLGVGVFTIPSALGELYISAMREDVDIINTDYDRGEAPNASSARSLIEEKTSLVYMNTAQQMGYPVYYKRTDTTDFTVADGAAKPKFELLDVASDEDRVGGSLVFSGGQSITTYDADNEKDGGFLVTAVVNFDDLTSGATAVIVAKKDSGGFVLEQTGKQLRFGVNIGGSYIYATAQLSDYITGTHSYFIVGAYDGKGAVRLWVNNDEKAASASVSGGVVANNSPIVIGADPQGATDRRSFFKGKVQQVMVQKWRDH